MYEFEIKLSRSDFLNDANKGLSFGHTKEYYESLGIDLAGTKYERLMEGDKSGPSKFWYIVPEILLSTIEIPTFAGCLCAVRRGRFIFFKEEKKAPRLHKNKLSEEIKDNLMHKLCFRYWRERNRNYERFLAEAGKGE